MRFSANIGFLWDHLPLPDRIAVAAKSGFDAVECHFPYEYDASEVRDTLLHYDLPMVGINTALGPPGCFGIASVPGQQKQARQLIDQALQYAIAIDSANINVVAGLTEGDAAAEEVYRENLRYACDKAAEFEKTIVIEPLNPRAVANYHLRTVENAVDTIEAVGTSNLKLMFDFFHAQIVEGDLEKLVMENVERFGHVQISAVHDRGEPDSGEINYPYVLNVLGRAGYKGYIGAEYKPRGKSVEEGLSWLDHFRKQVGTNSD